MLFNSIEFIFIFLPITFALFYFSVKYTNVRIGLFVLSIASLFFYGYWNLPCLFLLIASISTNYLISKILISKQPNKITRRIILYSGVILNLSLIGFFKYYITIGYFLFHIPTDYLYNR